MEETQALDENGQQPKDEELMSSDEGGTGAFDADVFASMMQQELIAYNVSWDPLMKVLQALGASMAKQQQTQKSNQDAVGGVQDQVNALQDELTSVKDVKQEMATAMEKMQGQMEDLQGQLEQMQALQPQHELEQQQQEAAGHEETPGDESTRASDSTDSASKQAAPRSNSIGRQPFVTAKELADVKKELSKELKKALAHAFGHRIDEGDEDGDEDSNDADPSAQAEKAAEAVGGKEGTEAVLDSEGTPRSLGGLGMAGGFQPPGVPFASDAKLQEELTKLHELQEALNAKMAEHDQRLDALQSGAGNLDELFSQTANTGSPSSSMKSPPVINGSSGNSDDNGFKSDDLNFASETPRGKDGDAAVNTTALLRDLKELKALQEMHDQKLKDHDDAMEKHTAEIKTLTDSLDDLNVQQQVAASMYAPSSSRGGEEGAQSRESGKDGSGGESNATSTATSEGVGKASKQGKSSERGSEATSQPQLDLSLVFTKLADLRRSTDASLNTLQQSIKGVSGTTQSQQEQLDALRNSLVFNEHLQIHLVESRLAMQKELLARNQTFQDRTKPQLAEWRKALELNEDKLLQGTCDDETLHALQQLQRYYHRTVLSIAPLVNSPLSIAETMQTLSDEVKQLQNAVQVGVVPLRISDGSSSGDGGEGEPNKDEREEEYTRKLRYLDEEIDATLQVNIMTEKKNDPLIKALDTMREKLESLWSMWHRNYNDQRSLGSGATSVREDSGGNGSNSLTSGSGSEERRQSMQQSNPEGLRELELRLMGAVRRLGMVEEDIERLNSVTAALNPTELSSHTVGTGTSGSGTTITGRRAPSTNNLKAESAMEELDKLRQEMYTEIANIKALLPGGNGGSSGLSYLGNSSSLVPLDRRSMVEAAAKQGDVLTDLYSQMTGRELDTRLYNTPEGQKQFYDNFLKEVIKKVSHAMLNSDKATGGHRGPSGPGVGGATNANVNYRLLLDNFAQKVDDRLEDARELTVEEMARLRKELMDQLKLRFEVALRDLRGELMLFAPTDGDSTAMGTKPVMCVACSRPVPVSGVIREVGSLPPGDLVSPESVNPVQTTDYEYDRADDDFVFRAGFKMPATDRKIMTLPFLTSAMRSKLVLNKPEGKRKRPSRHSHLNSSSRVDNIVREAMELDRGSRGRGHDAPS